MNWRFIRSNWRCRTRRCGKLSRNWRRPAIATSIFTYAACGGVFWLFVAVCALYESLTERRWLLGLSFALVAALLAHVEGVVLFRVSALDAYTYLLPISWEIKG